MSDPRRLLDLEDDDRADLLREPLDLEPPPDAKARVYAAVIATVGFPGGGDSGPSGGESGAAGSGSAAGPAVSGAAGTGAASVAGASAQVGGFSALVAAKWAFIGGAGAALVLGASVALEPSRPTAGPPTPSSPTLVAFSAQAGPAIGVGAGLVSPSASANQATSAPTIDVPTISTARPSAGAASPGARALVPPSADPPGAALVPVPVPVPESSAIPSAAPSASSSASRLLEENRLLGVARASLHGGNAVGALQTIEASRAQFPRAVLAQERDALEVEALSVSGRHGDARAKAGIFLERYPTSPHAQRMSELSR